MTELDRIEKIGRKAFDAFMEVAGRLPEYQDYEAFFTHGKERETHPDCRRLNMIHILQTYQPRKEI